VNLGKICRHLGFEFGRAHESLRLVGTLLLGALSLVFLQRFVVCLGRKSGKIRQGIVALLHTELL
jgi:hypothetical protein